MLLSEHLDKKLQLYISKNKRRRWGYYITTHIVMAAISGLLLASNKTRLVEYGGHVKINRAWAQSFLERIGYVKRKATCYIKEQVQLNRL